MAIDTLHNEFYPKINSIDEHDIIFISNVLNGLLVDYDAISPDRTGKVIDLIEGIGKAPSYSVPINAYDRKIVLDAINKAGSYVIVHLKKYFNTDFGDFDSKPQLIQLEGFYLRYRTAVQGYIDKSSLR